MDFLITILNIFFNTFNWKGKASRSEFNSYIVFILIVAFIIGFSIIKLMSEKDLDEQTFDHIINIIAVLLYMPFISLSIRRLRDMNRPIWLHLLYYIPFVGIYVIYLQCTETSRSNSGW